MARLRVQAFIRDEAGNKLGGTGYEVRFYQAGTNTLQTLFPDAASASTIPNPHYPNAGVQTALTAATLTTDTTIAVQSVNGISQGDFITLDNGTNRVELVVLSIAALVITLNAAIGVAFTVANTRVNGRENMGHVAAYCDTAADIEMTVKNLATGIEGPREMFRITPAAANDFVKIADGVLTAGAFTFLAIPATYKSLELVWQGRGDQAALGTVLQIQINADTGANYDDELHYGAGSTSTASESLAGTSGRVGSVPAATATAGNAGAGVIEFPNYAGTTFRKSWTARFMRSDNESTGNEYTGTAGGKYRTTSALASIKLFLASGNLVAGSVATLYGKK